MLSGGGPSVGRASGVEASLLSLGPVHEDASLAKSRQCGLNVPGRESFLSVEVDPLPRLRQDPSEFILLPEFFLTHVVPVCGGIAFKLVRSSFFRLF